ncbi:MAG TPA: class I tRNA ligase family protein, partial [Clostridiales bacterium]|nr:class I tRNA ligase family protein [Clostridiales bacterium]
MEKKPYYITTAIAYTSRKPHIGNSYEIVLTDAIARFKRMQGFDVFFLTGTDEHGQKIEECAKQAGCSPNDYVDKIALEIKQICDLLNTTYDKFIRTTDEYHIKAVQNIFKKLYEQGDIYKGEYEGMYCVPCEGFYTQSQLSDGKCPECGSETVPAKEEAYFLRLSRYQKRLEEYIENNPDFIFPESRKKEMLNNFIKPGLQDLCVSRTSFKWGIPVTFDEKHVIYVWVDALSNYITALGFDAGEN